MAGVIARLIARFKCWRYGHKRGKRLPADLAATVTEANAGLSQFQCPRCKTTWTRKVKAVTA